MGDAVLQALAEEPRTVVKHLAVNEIPRSGPPAVLVDLYGLSARHIVKAAEGLLKVQV